MTWRFRKSVKLFPGVRVNLSRRGISTTVGVRGLSVNLGPSGTYLNQGIPVPVLYSPTKPGERTPSPGQAPQSPQSLPPREEPITLPEMGEVGAIKSAAAEGVTSAGLVGLKGTLQETFAEFVELRREISATWQERNQKQEGGG